MSACILAAAPDGSCLTCTAGRMKGEGKEPPAITLVLLGGLTMELRLNMIFEWKGGGEKKTKQRRVNRIKEKEK